MIVPPSRGQRSHMKSKASVGKRVWMKGSAIDRTAAVRATYFLALFSNRSVVRKPESNSKIGTNIPIGILLFISRFV